MTAPIVDSGHREEFSTGSVRDRQYGKGRHDLLMTHAIDELAKHTEDGCAKYGEDNWRLGQPLRQYLASSMRHLLKLLRGETDERHDRALLWNIAAFIETKAMIQDGILSDNLDDLKDYTTKEGFDRTVRQPLLGPPAERDPALPDDRAFAASLRESIVEGHKILQDWFDKHPEAR